MSMTMDATPTTYQRTLDRQHKERLARLRAGAVHDDGIDLRRARNPIVKPVAVMPAVEPDPIVPLTPEAIAALCGVGPTPAVEKPADEPIENIRIVSKPIGRIQTVVAEYFNISKLELLSARRTHNLVRPRQIAVYLACRLTPRALNYIGSRFGDRDHTTVIHAIRRITELRRTDHAISQSISALAVILAADGFDVGPLGIEAVPA